MAASSAVCGKLRNRRFFSLAELNEAVPECVTTINTKVMKPLKQSRNDLYDTLDRPALRELPRERHQYAEWKPCTVAPDTKARILLKADVSEAGDGWSDSAIAAALDTSIATVERTRRQPVEEGFAAVLTRKYNSKSARSRIFDGAAEAELIALTLSPPPDGFARWTLCLLEEKVVVLRLLENQPVRRLMIAATDRLGKINLLLAGRFGGVRFPGEDGGKKRGVARGCVAAQQAQNQAQFIENHQGDSRPAAIAPGADCAGTRLALGAPQPLDDRDRAIQSGRGIAFRNPPVAPPHLFVTAPAGNQSCDPVLVDRKARCRRECRLDLGARRRHRRAAGSPDQSGGAPSTREVPFGA